MGVDGPAPPPRGRTFSFEVESVLAAEASQVWAHAMTMEGVNHELGPLVRMTAPASFARLDAAPPPLGSRLLRSWVLLFGVLPVDWDDLTFVEFEPGRRFLERSPMLTQRAWEHERVVEPFGAGCRVRDTVRFEPRIAALGLLQLPVFRFVFRHRHRRLVGLFGAGRA